MKKISTIVLFISLGLSTMATTWTVNVQDFFFSPANLPNVVVGDTIKWQWIGPTHNHTSTSMTIPGGAPAWDAPLDAGNLTFSYVITVAGSYHYVCTPHFPGMEADFTAAPNGITQIGTGVPQKFSLNQNYPNPFNPTTEITFDIPRSAYVKLIVLNMLGQEIEVLVNGQLNAGSYKADWNATDFPSGVYIYKLISGEFSDTKKMILVK